MRRTKWDTPAKDSVSSLGSSLLTSGKSASPAATSADIEMVKALAKRRLEELMAQKITGSSDASPSSAASSLSSSSLFSGTAASVAQTGSPAQRQSIVSESVQKAAAIAAAFQALPQQPPVPSSTSSYFNPYSAENMQIQHPPGMLKTPPPQDASSSAASASPSFSPQNYAGSSAVYPPGYGGGAVPGSFTVPYVGGGGPNMYQQVSNGMPQNVAGQAGFYNAVPPAACMPGGAAPAMWSAAAGGAYGNASNAFPDTSSQAPAAEGYSPYLKYASSAAKKKSSEESSDGDDGEKELLSKTEGTSSSSTSTGTKGEEEKEVALRHIFGASMEEEREAEFKYCIEQSANGMYTTDIDINFSKARTRLVRKEALQVIRLRTGAAVISRGKLKEDPSSPEKGLHVRITADTEEKVKNAGLIIEKLMVENVERVNIRFEVSYDGSFDCLNTLKGEGEQNLEWIMRISKAFVEVRGKGSMHPEDANRTDQEPMHLLIYGITELSRLKGLSLSQKLVEHVHKEWEEKCRKVGSPQFPGVCYNPQQLYPHQMMADGRPPMMSSPPPFLSPYGSVPSPPGGAPPLLSPYGYMPKSGGMQSPGMFNTNMNVLSNVPGVMANGMMHSPSPFGMSPYGAPRPAQALNPVAPATPFGMSWQNILTDEKEQARRRKEMEEKRKKREEQREKERKERKKEKKRHSKSRSKSRSRSRSRSPDDKDTSKTKVFNFVPPPSGLYGGSDSPPPTVTSSVGTADDGDDDDGLTNEEIISQQNLINEQYKAATSPPKDVHPSAFLPGKNDKAKSLNTDVDRDREIMPPPPPISFIKKTKSESEKLTSSVSCAPTTSDGKPVGSGIGFIQSTHETVEIAEPADSASSSQSVSLVAYEDDSEEE